MAVDVGRGSLLTVGGGAGTITNNGTIRILAGAGVPADATQYAPISAGTWSGGGTYQAIGGTWNTIGHTFTASSVTSGASGTPVALDLASAQRALVSDNGTGGTGWVVGASFPAAGSTTNITFSAAPMSSTTLDALTSLLPTNGSVLSGWTFSTDGYNLDSSNPIYFSFKVGAGYPSDELEAWHYGGTAWTEYPATDLTYDGNYASFTATGLSDYAMVHVPEPGTLVLLVVGLAACAWRRKPRRRTTISDRRDWELISPR